MCTSYKVPLIPQNLSQEETIVQIAEVLNYISEVTEDVFRTVNRRLKSNNVKLGEISGRIDECAAKVDSLKGAKKATQVFSSSKYPAADMSTDYISIFESCSKLELKRHEVKHSNYSSAYEPLSKLQFYHVKVDENKPKTNPTGLGDIPLNVNCVNDLLLYNTGKNVYKDFSMTDSLRVSEGKCTYDNYRASEIGAPPTSISQRSLMSKSTKKDYFYAPKSEELPALDLPLDLPDLPGVADDLRYQSDVGPSIAPSAFNSSILGDIPDLPSITEMENKVTDSKEVPEVSVQEVPIPPPIVELPPISPPVEIMQDIAPFDDPKPVAQPRISISDDHQQAKTLARSNVPPPQTDVHASLMEAIRQAGGSRKAKLRSTEQEGGEALKKVSAPAGDLMADLHNKLLMRRKGISGTKKPEQNITPESTLGSISAMIPAPTPQIEAETTTSTDDEEDWK